MHRRARVRPPPLRPHPISIDPPHTTLPIHPGQVDLPWSGRGAAVRCGAGGNRMKQERMRAIIVVSSEVHELSVACFADGVRSRAGSLPPRSSKAHGTGQNKSASIDSGEFGWIR